ncbi:hypothetical protein DPMN_121584, partial [Dreissena polymorpha]
MFSCDRFGDYAPTGFTGSLNFCQERSENPIGDDRCGNRILKAFANSLDPDETPQNVASHLDPN